MKQTIELEGNRKAVVQIPYSKLTANSTAYQQGTHNSHCCDSKVVLVGCGGGCSSKGRQNNSEMRAIIAELEESYDKDVRELQNKVEQQKKERDQARKDYADELLKLKRGYENKLQEKISAVQLLKVECRRKDLEIAALLNEKEIIIKNKINQFRQNEYIDKINELQSIIRLRDVELKELTAKLEGSMQQRIKIEEVRSVDSGNWEREVNNLKMDLAELQDRYSRQRSQNQAEWARKSEQWIAKVKSYEVQLEQTSRYGRDIKSESEMLHTSLKSQIQSLITVNSDLKQILKQEKEKTGKLQSDMNLALDDIKQLKAQNFVLLDRLQKSEEAVLMIDRQKDGLLLELESKLAEVHTLKLDLSNKEKVYEVKIQRVIDGKPQIQQLRGVIAELEMQLKQFNQEKEDLKEEVRKRQLANDELRGVILKMEAELAELRMYIEKREGSFKWAVEREIERDIVVSQSQPHFYKVSQVREYVRDVSPANDKALFDRISSGIHQSLNSSFPEQVILTSQKQPIPQ